METLWAHLVRTAKTQHGLITVWQAEQLGINRTVLARRLREQGWRRVVRGVYLLPGADLTPIVSMHAAVLAIGGKDQRLVALSHTSAGYLWGLRHKLERPVEVSVPTDRHPVLDGVRVHRPTHLDFERHLVMRASMPVVIPEVTICLLARTSSVDQLVQDIATLDRKTLATRDSIAGVARDLGLFLGWPRVVQAFDRLAKEGLTHSDLERLARRILRDAGIPPFPDQYTVEDEYGDPVAKADIVFIAEKVIVEVDGSHHNEPGQRRFDEDQRQRLEALGWIIVRADKVRLTEQPAVFVRQVRAALARGAV